MEKGVTVSHIGASEMMREENHPLVFTKSLFSSLRSGHQWVDRPWPVCRAILGLSLMGYAVVFALELFRWEFAPLIAEASRLLFWWALLPVWAASVIQGLRVNWRQAGWAVLEASVAGVLALVFSVGLLNYAYHHERQQMERAIAHRGLR